MLDPELKAEFDKIHTKFDTKFNAGFAHLEESINELARSTAAGFMEVDRRFEQVDERFEQIDERFDQMDVRFDRLDSKLQNQIDSLMSSKADRTELIPMKAQLLNLQTT